MWRVKTVTKFKNSFFPGLIYWNHNRIHWNTSKKSISVSMVPPLLEGLNNLCHPGDSNDPDRVLVTLVHVKVNLSCWSQHNKEIKGQKVKKTKNLDKYSREHKNQKKWWKDPKNIHKHDSNTIIRGLTRTNTFVLDTLFDSILYLFCFMRQECHPNCNRAEGSFPYRETNRGQMQMDSATLLHQ